MKGTEAKAAGETKNQSERVMIAYQTIIVNNEHNI